jgi:hypothetical protein
MPAARLDEQVGHHLGNELSVKLGLGPVCEAIIEIYLGSLGHDARSHPVVVAVNGYEYSRASPEFGGAGNSVRPVEASIPGNPFGVNE